VFKNVMLYRTGEGWTPSLPKIEEALQRARFVECRPTQEKSSGWTPPRGEREGALVESVGGQLLMKFMIETKMLPATVVRRKLDERVEQIEAQSGRKPGKNQKLELKEQITASLLPQAFTKQASVTVWIDPKARFLVIDTTTKARADEVMTSLIRSLEGFTVALIKTAFSPGAAMSEWLVSREAPGSFYLDRECELKSHDDMQSAVRYSRHALDIAEIRQHVAGGKMATRLGMAWEDKITFVLTDEMQVRRIRFQDGVLKGGEGEEEDRFDTDATIATGELAKLIPQLIAALGGES
jgi:recombination associated protein RdgC